MRQAPRTPGLLLVLFLALVSAGCGFHLRGAVDVTLPPEMQHTALQGAAPESRLGDMVRSGLEQLGAGLAETTDAATAVLSLGERLQRRVVSVDNAGRANEYELHYQLRFAVHDAAGSVLAPDQAIDVYRSYLFDPTQILAGANEEAQLRDEMQAAAVAQMLRRIERGAQSAPVAP